MRHLAVPHYLAHHRADGSTLLGHGHIVDVVVEHGQQLTHQVKFHPCQNAFVRKAFQFPDAGTQGGILCVQFLDALFQVDCGGAVSKIGKGVDEGGDLPLRLGLLFAQGGKLRVSEVSTDMDERPMFLCTGAARVWVSGS